MADFETMFRENQGFILRYLLGLCHDAALAEELTQETFFRAYMNLSSLRDEKKAAAWLCRIARNAYFAWYREQKHLAPLDERSGDTPDIAEEYVMRELSGQALRALHALEEPYREVFLLAVYGQVPLREISALYGRSESWARVTFYRAKQKLMEEMR